MKAVEIANYLFDTNKYQTMKELEKEKKTIEKELKSRMNTKREVHQSTGTVMKMVANNSYEVNIIELNKFLHSYGVLPYTVKIDTKHVSPEVLRKISPFINEEEYYVRLYAKLPKIEFDFSGTNKSELIKRWNEVTNKFKILQNEYQQARELMGKCEELKKQKKMKFKYGTISMIKKEDTYNIGLILQEFGSEFVINNTTPVFNKIDKFIEEGYFPQSEINQFKTVTKVDFKFVVTTLEEESKFMNYLNNKNSKASIKREKLKRQVM